MLGIKVLVVAGLAGYLTLFVINNVTDPRTNSAAIPRMMSMRDLAADPPLGSGVLWRAIDSPAVHRLLQVGLAAVIVVNLPAQEIA